MFKKTALLTAIGLALSATAQADYRFEVAPKIIGGDFSGISVDGTAYLKSVDTSKGPLAEAAFQDHASFVNLNYADGETDIDGPVDDLESENYGINGRLVSGAGGWILDLGYGYSETDSPFNNGPDKFETDQYSVGLGKYLTDNTTLVFSYAYTDVDDVGDGDSYGVDLEHLFQWDWSDLKLAAGYGRAELDNDDDVDVWQLVGTLYPCDNFGVGAAYRNTDDRGGELEQYAAFAEYFITEQVAVSLEYQEGEFDGSDADADAIVFGARVRF